MTDVIKLNFIQAKQVSRVEACKDPKNPIEIVHTYTTSSSNAHKNDSVNVEEEGY